MRKVHYFLTLMLLASFANVKAQYSDVTGLSGAGVAMPGNISYTVTQSNPAPSSATTLCVAPYQIGRLYSDYYEYDFPNKITNARIQMIRIHNDDTIKIEYDDGLGGGWQNYPLTAANLSPFGAACTPAYTTNNMFTITADGLFGTTGGAVGNGQGVQIDLQVTPNTISKLRITHIRHATNIIASDVIYGLSVLNDSCQLGFTATVDSPACSGYNLQLDATIFPNTTYAWTQVTPNLPPYTPSANIRNPVLVNVNQAHSGTYYVTATRGTGPNACIYRDTLTILVNQSPSLGTVLQTGPVCPNEDDTIKVPNANLPTGGWVVAFGPQLGTYQDTFDATQGYINVKNNVQFSQKGTYYIYAQGIQGCRSDTTTFEFDVNEDVASAFTFTVNEGCEQDTINFKNASAPAGNLTHNWSFGSTEQDPSQLFAVPKPNYDDSRVLPVRLIVSNGKCFDTSSQNVIISHPVKAEFTIVEDSLCQGATVVFNDAEDSSKVKPGTIPDVRWEFGDGTFDEADKFDNQYTYNVSGIYYPTLIITDFLKCSDTFRLEVVIDSSGFGDFKTDKQSVCVGDEILYEGIYSNVGYVSAVWDLGDGVKITDSNNLRHSYNDPGTYDVTFNIDYRICDDVTVSSQIEVKPIPTVYLGSDTAICLNGDPIFIEDIYNKGNSDGITYTWNTPTKDVTSGIYVRHHGIYALTAEKDGCFASDSLEVKKNCYINIPNAFTPNGDGNSDYFLPRQMISRNVSKFDMKIYNRWGEQIFETNATNGRGWDGKYGGVEQPTGVYIYIIDVAFGNGYTERYQGNVTLVR